MGGKLIISQGKTTFLHYYKMKSAKNGLYLHHSETFGRAEPQEVV